MGGDRGGERRRVKKREGERRRVKEGEKRGREQCYTQHVSPARVRVNAPEHTSSWLDLLCLPYQLHCEWAHQGPGWCPACHSWCRR